MRRLITIIIAAVITMTLLILKANGQGRSNGHGRGHHKQEWKKEHTRHNGNGHGDQYSYDSHGDGVSHYYSGGHYVYHQPVYIHEHSRVCGHRIVVRNYETPRYVYYRDYDVYYDYHRNVYFSYSGRGWTVSTSLPVHLHHVNFSRAVCHEVNYYEDDFVTYLDRGRPMYGRVAYASR
jgi:hypothetical protein